MSYQETKFVCLCAYLNFSPPLENGHEQQRRKQLISGCLRIDKTRLFAVVDNIKHSWYQVDLSCSNNVVQALFIHQALTGLVVNKLSWQGAAQHCCNLFWTIVNKLLTTCNNMMIFTRVEFKLEWKGRLVEKFCEHRYT
jgi:hypothetical protein